MLKCMIELGEWSDKQNEEIDGLQSDIHKIRRGLLDFVFNKTKLEQARSLLRRAESALLQRLSQRHDLCKNSADAQALIFQQRFLISRITERENGDPVWMNTGDFQKSDDITLIMQLCELFFRQSRISTQMIRELARSQQWRMYWEISKNTNDLFDGSIMSWSLSQKELVYWSTIYDSVYDAYERPSKDIIVDDDMLDSWFIRQSEKVESKRQTEMSTTSNKPGMNEEFIMADKEGAKTVYNMNDPSSRIKIKAREKLLNKQGAIKEQDMPDSKREIRKQAMEKRSQRVKDIGHR